EFQNYQEAYETVTNYLLFYNQRRIHGSLYDLSPVEFSKAFAQQRVKPFVVKV
ncbi:IS3 family transposase, partial [Brevibacillus parabrevis]